MGWSNVDQTVAVPFESTRLPSSCKEAEETPRFEVPESQTVEPDPFTSRRAPVDRNWNEPPESTVEPLPADQITGVPPEYTMAAKKEGGEVWGSEGRKCRENVLLGEDHVWFVLEARRVEPGEMAPAPAEMAARKTAVCSRAWIIRSSIF